MYKPIFVMKKADRKYVIENIHNLVVKQTDAKWLWNVGPNLLKRTKQVLQK
jgi:uncharacterized circularly permuted ATP-grasp superfamily protein